MRRAFWSAMPPQRMASATCTNGGVRDLLPAGEPRLELGERPLGVDVRGVLRQDGRHDLVDDRQLGLGHERALVGAQPSLHLPDALVARRRP